jgi:hypothetical protein
LSYAVLLLGVYPSTVPLSSMVLDISSYDIRKLSTTFTVDKIVAGSPILNKLYQEHSELVNSVVSLLRQSAVEANQ